MRFDVSRVYPKKYKKWVRKNLEYAGLSIKLGKFLNLKFVYSLSLALFVFVFARTNFKLDLMICGFLSLGSLVGFQVCVDVIVNLIGDRRGKFAEEILPDALQLMAANARSGLTPDKAILLAARPEFGILEKEIKNAAKKAMAGGSLEDSLLEISKKIKSKIVDRTFTLIVEGLRKGGELAELLEHTAEDIRTLKTLKKEISAQVAMYAIFIFISIGIAAPLLFAFSSYLVETMSEIGSKLRLEEALAYGHAYGLRFGVVKISQKFLRIYSFASLAIVSFFGSLLIGLLQGGSEKAGIKYIPLLLLLTFTIFLVSKTLIASVAGFLAPGGLSVP